MIRPLTATVACRACGGYRLGAFLGLSTSVRAQFLFQLCRNSSPNRSKYRSFSSQRHPSTASHLENESRALPTSNDQQSSVELTEDAADDKPWFLETEAPPNPLSLHRPALPKIPSNVPPLLKATVDYISDDMGLDELALFDLRELDPPAALGPNLVMLFGTARSEKHLHVSSGRLIRWLRRNYRVEARADGLLGPGELRTKLRRLRKRAKLLGTNSLMLNSGDNGISTGWICISFSDGTGETADTSKFDGNGRMPGFEGTAPEGTTIVVQCMTESRRNELNLELLWQGVLRRNFERIWKIQGKLADDTTALEALVSSKIQLPTNSSALQWQALQRASQQRRQYSTTTQLLHASTGDNLSGTNASPYHLGKQSPARAVQSVGANLDVLRLQIRTLQLGGLPLTRESLESFIMALFRAPSRSPDSAKERLILLDELLLTAHERGLSVWQPEILVGLIENLGRSPASGPDLQQSQKNLEMLLAEMQTGLDNDQVLRLMAMQAEQKNWGRFWDAFRWPPRFLRQRSAELYELAYRSMANSGDPKMCTEALRWVYQEMLREEPPILPVGRLYEALKACILVADPAAEELLHNPPPPASMDLFGRRKLKHREFVMVLRDVEQLRSHRVGSQAKEETSQTLSNFHDGTMPGVA